jgi:hypothetical protein
MDDIVVANLGNPCAETRKRAAQTLGMAANLGANITVAIPALVKALSDEVSDVRSYVAWGLGRGALQGADITVAMPALANLLSDADGDVRWNATEALENATANGKSRDAALAVLEHALSDGNLHARRNAAKALTGSVGKCASVESLNTLETNIRECHVALEIKCRYGRDGKMQLFGALCSGLFNAIAKRRNELASQRDILLDGVPRPPKQGQVYREMRRVLAHG